MSLTSMIDKRSTTSIFLPPTIIAFTMAKKSNLKAALASHQTRLQKNAKAKEASQKYQKQVTKPKRSGVQPVSKSDPSRHMSGREIKSTIPFRQTDTILLVGEGNFSFARALLSHPSLQYLPPKNMTATSYDSEDTCYNKYPEARQIVEDLRGRGVEVSFSVDATALEKCKSLKGRRWDRVVWNFPHAGAIRVPNSSIFSTYRLLLYAFREGNNRSRSQYTVKSASTSRLSEISCSVPCDRSCTFRAYAAKEEEFGGE